MTGTGSEPIGGTMQYLINGAVLAAIYCLFALGLSLTWGTLNVLNLAHGAVFMFSGFSCYVITRQLFPGLGFVVLLLIAIVVGALLEVFLDTVVFRAIRRRAGSLLESELSTMIATIGGAAVAVAVVTRVTNGQQFTISPKPIEVGVMPVLGATLTSIEIVIVAVSVVATVGLGLWIKHSRDGRALRALAVDASTTGLMGVNARRLSTVVQLISGGTAGAAGVFLAVFLANLQATSGQDLLLKAFAAVVLGGVGSVWGTMVGAVVLASGETIVRATTSGLWTDAVSFAIILLVLLALPNGLFGRARVDRV